MNQLIVNGVVAGSLYVLIGLGFSLIYRTVGFFHLSHGGIYTVAAYLAFTFLVILRLPLVPAVILAVCISATLGVGIQAFIYRPLIRRKADSLVLLISSLGILIIIESFVPLVFGDETKSLRSNAVLAGFEVFGLRITLPQIFIVLVAGLLSGGCWAFLRFTKLGLIIRAVADDRELSQIVGTDVEKVIRLVFFYGSALAAIASILFAFDAALSPLMGLDAVIVGIIVTIIGGTWKIVGVIPAGLFLGLAQHLGVWKFPTRWQETITFLILILFLLIAPRERFPKQPAKRLV